MARPTRLDRLGSRYWFVPTLLTLGAIALALVTLRLDARVAPGDLPSVPLLSGWVRADGARTLLGTVAGSLITVLGLVVSLTMGAPPPDDAPEGDGVDADVIPLRSGHTGYLQAIDGPGLAHLALGESANDPFTAIDAADRLAEGLELPSRRAPPPTV